MSAAPDLPPIAVEPVTADPPGLSRRTVLRQRWEELVYVHWSYPPDVVQRLLPAGVRVDTFDGVAWVGLIPFEMRRVRIGPTPPVPYLGDFVEINVRTYVIDPLGRRAVWFFSLDVPRSVIVGVARSVFALPYCFARAEHRVDGRRHRYELARRWPHRDRAHATIDVRVGRALPPDEVTDLDHFLSARWALVTTRLGRLQYGAVDHPRWPLHEVDDWQVDQDVLSAAGLPAPVGEPVVRYSPGVPVELAWFETVRAAS